MVEPLGKSLTFPQKVKQLAYVLVFLLLGIPKRRQMSAQKFIHKCS